MSFSEQDSTLSDGLANASVPSDPSTASETERIDRESTGLPHADDKTFNNLRSALASQHIELQHFIEDWSGRQHRLMDTALTTWDTFKGQPLLSGKSLDLSPTGSACHRMERCETQDHEKVGFRLWDGNSSDATGRMKNTHMDHRKSDMNDQGVHLQNENRSAFLGSLLPHGHSATSAWDLPDEIDEDSNEDFPLSEERYAVEDSAQLANKEDSVKFASQGAEDERTISDIIRESMGRMNSMHMEEPLYRKEKTRGGSLFAPLDSAFFSNGRSTRASPSSQMSFYKWCKLTYRDAEYTLKNEDRRSLYVKCALSNWFGAVTALVILLNSIFIGFSSEYATKNLRDQTTTLMDVLEWLFMAFYTFELLFRMFSLGWHFILTPDWRWNLFDSILVVIAIWDMIIQLADPDASGGASHARVARLPKMFRLVRVFRIVRMLRKLRVLLNSIVGSVKAMLWSIVLILLITYVNGVVILQGAIAQRRDALDEPNLDIQDIEKYWGSLKDAMLSLYSSSTGGIDWMVVAESVKPLGSIYYMVFLLYMTFFILVVMNTLTSLFVSSALRSAEQDKETVIAEALRNKKEQVTKMKTIFNNIGHNKGLLWQPDFELVLQDSEMMAFMSTLEIEPMDVEQFFNVISNDGKVGVDIHDFVNGCLRMGGHARSMDLLGLIHTHKAQARRIRKIEKDLGSIKTLLQGKNRAEGGLAISTSTSLLTTSISTASL